MDARDEFKAYDLVAIHAGRQAGLDLPDAAAATAMADDVRRVLVAKVADSPDAVKLRDELYVDLERRLRDPGYSGQQVWQWFQKTYGPIGRTSIYRARAALRAQESAIAEIAAQARAYIDLAEESGADDVFRAASRRAGQLIFQLLMEANADRLGGRMNVNKLNGIVVSLAKLQKSRAETDLIAEKLAELRRRFDEQMAAATAKRPDGRLTDADIAEAREAIFGKVA